MRGLQEKVKKQWDSFKKYQEDLIEATAFAQIRAYFFIGFLLLFCVIADYTVLYQSNLGVNTGFKIKMGVVCYYLLAPMFMYFVHTHKKKMVIPLAYINILVGLLAVLFGLLFDGFSLNLSELFALILVPSFTVYGPNSIYQLVIFLTIIIDIGLEFYYIEGNNIFLHMIYFSFDSVCLYGMVAFVNLVMFNNKVKELGIRYELKKVSERDALTGLLNRSAAIVEIEKYNAIEGKYAMIVVDLDYFKEINDTYGHLKGDEVLKNMGKALRLTFNDIGTIARFGGDEFMVFLPFIDENVLCEKLATLRRHFKNINSEYKENTFSFGYSILENDENYELFKSLFNKADENMYKQKISKKHET